MRYNSCHLLEHGISIEKEVIKNCCLAKPTNELEPIVLESYNAQNIDWDKLFENKRRQRQAQKTDRIPECQGCYVSENQDWDEKDYLSYINFNHWMKCNSNCIYCYTQYCKDKSHENIYSSIAELINRNQFRNTGEITFQGGEPTILEEFDDLINLFLDQKAKIRVHSSGILYNSAIERGLKEGLLTVVISPDAGDEETYKKVKRVNSFKKVCENIKKYSELLDENNKHLLQVKYIIIPGCNDSVKQIDNWLKIAIDNKVKNIIFDIEFIYQKNNPEMSKHIYMLMDYIKYRAKKANINCSLYDSAIYAEKTRTLPEYKRLVKIKPILNLFVNFYKKKNIKNNINYGV